jgi:hypothetical protein
MNARRTRRPQRLVVILFRRTSLDDFSTHAVDAARSLFPRAGPEFLSLLPQSGIFY